MRDRAKAEEGETVVSRHFILPSKAAIPSPTTTPSPFFVDIFGSIYPMWHRCSFFFFEDLMTLSKTQGYTLRTPDKVKGRYAYL